MGEWKDDKHNGQGSITSPDGRKYVGKFKEEKKHGQGTFISPNGDKYVGECKDGDKHGQGTFTFSDGKKVWVNSEKMDLGTPQYTKKTET